MEMLRELHGGVAATAVVVVWVSCGQLLLYGCHEGSCCCCPLKALTRLVRLGEKNFRNNLSVPAAAESCTFTSPSDQ